MPSLNEIKSPLILSSWEMIPSQFSNLPYFIHLRYVCTHPFYLPFYFKDRQLLCPRPDFTSVTRITQISKLVLCFTIRRNVQFGDLNANPCTKFNM